jgi:hypothetical protein
MRDFPKDSDRAKAIRATVSRSHSRQSAPATGEGAPSVQRAFDGDEMLRLQSADDATRAASSDEVKDLRGEASALKGSRHSYAPGGD